MHPRACTHPRVPDRYPPADIIVDEGSDSALYRGAYPDLMTLLMSTLASRLPSIAIQTGFSQKRPLSGKFISSLGTAVDIAMVYKRGSSSGPQHSPLLLLTARV